MKISTGSEQEQRRDELLRVATVLAAGLNANPAYDYKIEIVDWATDQAKDLIEKVDAEFEGTPQVTDSMRDAAPEMYEMLELAVSYMDGGNTRELVHNYQDIATLLAKARGEV